MGADLRDAKRVCKEDGTLFAAWCESNECPVGYRTATRLISVSDRLGNNAPGGIFENGFRVIAEITQTRDEDIRQALLEHVTKEQEEGRNVTKQEITAIKKALKEAQSQALYPPLWRLAPGGNTNAPPAPRGRRGGLPTRPELTHGVYKSSTSRTFNLPTLRGSGPARRLGRAEGPNTLSTISAH
jgi:hypothetical protein